MSTTATRAGALCGALVGVCSALLTAAAHTAAAGMPPSGAAAVMVLLVGAAVGATAGAVAVTGRRAPVGHVVIALAAGQVLGHGVLAMASWSHGGHGLLPNPPMLLAHAAAAVLVGVLISLVAHLYVVCVSVLCWLSLVVVHRSQPRPRPISGVKAVVVEPVWVGPGLRMRAPPLVAC